MPRKQSSEAAGESYKSRIAWNGVVPYKPSPRVPQGSGVDAASGAGSGKPPLASKGHEGRPGLRKFLLMRSAVHGSLATLLMLVPILAVPLLAIFGVPQFTPVVASPFDTATNAAARSDAPRFQSPEEPPADEFQVASADTDTWADAGTDAASRVLADRRSQSLGGMDASPSRDTSGAQRGGPSRLAGPSGSTRTPNEPAAAASGSTGRDAGSVGTVEHAGGYRRQRPLGEKPVELIASHTAAPLTWQTAVKRLNQLEIRNYRLEPGAQANRFVFICSYTPADNPRVSYRFEAEADEPLRAVEKVLEQIQTSLAAR